MRTNGRRFPPFPLSAALSLLLGATVFAQTAPSPQAEPAISTPGAPSPSAPEPMSARVAAPSATASAPTAPRPVITTPAASSVADPSPTALSSAAPRPAAPAVPASYAASASSAAARSAAPQRAAGRTAPAGPMDAARPRLSNALNRIAAVRAIVDDRVRTKALSASRAARLRAQLAREEKTAVARAGGGDLKTAQASALNAALDKIVLRLSPPKPAP